MLNPEDSNMAANAICHAALMSQEAFRQATYGYGTPSAIYRPKLFVDGNRWCALLGADLQSGVCGFGFLTAVLIVAVWGLIFMVICRVCTGQWWMTDDI